MYFFFRKAFFKWNLKLYLQSFEPSRRAFTPLSWYALLAFQGERGIGQLAHFISQALSRSHNSSALSLKEREGWDGSVTFCSFAALRVTARGRNPWPRCVRFALARSIEPSARVLIHQFFTWNKKRSLSASLFVSKEREGFEPSVLWQTPDFETGPFDHSGISPRFA